MNKYIITILSILLLCACTTGTGDEKTNNSFTVEGETVTIAEGSPIEHKIKLQTVVATDYSATFRTNGTVQALPSHYAEVAAPFAGRITKSFVRLGQQVAKGAPVFEIMSPEFNEISKSYFQAKQELSLAHKNAARERDLSANNVGSAKALEEAETNYELKQKDYENALAMLRYYQIDSETITAGQPLIVRTPVAGEVVSSKIVIGHFIKEDAEPLVTVADLSLVRIAALVKENCFGNIRHGDRVEVFTNAHPDIAIKGTIYYIGKKLNEETRSLEVTVECDNADQYLKLGMFCDVHFLSNPEKAIILPATAVMQEQDSDFVLIESGKRTYQRRKVKTETAGNNDNIRILSGLKEGDKVIVEGGIYLN
ncbi:MAG: efflux RND transporter periplasmic adaptor subunit [Tannerella sp.]|jgi:cobalt-zinc-cadmium efflux system membrane fusion protein|nr:efflux RND transporter periplasmic adaptor subunit [Tannerella sp.]